MKKLASKAVQYRAVNIRKVWRYVGRHVGHRGAVLAFLMVLDILYGYSLNVAPGPLAGVNLGFSIHSWSLIWFAVGVLLATGISARRDKVHFAIAATLKMAWAMVFLRAWLFDGYARGWVTFIIWAGFACLMLIISSWPEGFIRKPPLEDKRGDEDE